MNSASKGSFLSNKMKQKNPWKKLRQNSKIISNPVVTFVLRISFRTSSPNKSKSWISSKLPALEFPSESQEGLSKIADPKLLILKKNNRVLVVLKDSIGPGDVPTEFCGMEND